MAKGIEMHQSGQSVQGQETNVAGNAGIVLSGQFQGPVNVNPMGETLHPVPRQIPMPPQDFTGREDDLQGLLDHFERSSAIICLRGMGGVGKSALAFVLARKLKDRYPDGQIFVSMMGTGPRPLSAAEALTQVIRSYNPVFHLPDDEAELANLYRSVLSGKRALLLRDNVRDDSQVRALLPPAGCSLIITMRWRFSLAGMIVKSLGVLEIGQAVDLLQKTAGLQHAGEPGSRQDIWKDLARLCGCLPVALKAAGSYLACTTGSSPKKYMAELKDESKRLQAIGKEGVEEDVLTKFSLSYCRLSPETAKVFRLLSIFPADFDAKAEAVICQDEGHHRLIELERWSLAEYQRSGEEDEGRYHLHDLVRIYAKDQLEKDGEADIGKAHQLHSAYYLAVLERANKLLLEGGGSLGSGLKLFDLEWPNISAGQTWARIQSSESSECSEICSDYAWQGSILNLRLHSRENIRWLEAALDCARRIGNKNAEGAHLGNLGLACAALGDALKAIEYYEQHLAIAREIGDRRGEGNRLGNLGIAYARLGDAKKAIEYHEQALAIAREIGNRRGEGNALGNLGLAYARLGDARKAIEYYEQALAIAREIGDRRGEGNRLGNLGNACAALGNARKAIEYHEQALAIAREIGDRRGEGNRLGNLGNACAALGNARKAIEYYEQALAIAREIGNRRSEANASWNLGLEYETAGDLSRAAEMMQICVDYEREIRHPDAEKDAARLEAIRSSDLNKK